MKIIKTLLIIVVILVVLIGILTMIAPTKFALSRSTVINAPREIVFKNISTFANLHKWGPWDKKDTAMQFTIEGTDGTVGAMWKWNGNDQVGQGEQTLTKIDAGKEVDMHLHFIKPMNGQADAGITLVDTGTATKVTWQFNTSMARPFNIMSLFMNMDAAVGKDFEDGLNNLKELCEKEAAAATSSAGNYQINEVDRPMMVYIGKRETISIPDISKFFGENFPKLGADVQKAKLEMAGPPSGLFYSYDMQNMKTDAAAVFPVKEVKTPLSGWETINVSSGKALELDYYGDYAKEKAAYDALDAYTQQKGMKMKMACEEYITSPMAEKDTAKWLTKIYYYVE